LTIRHKSLNEKKVLSRCIIGSLFYRSGDAFHIRLGFRQSFLNFFKLYLQNKLAAHMIILYFVHIRNKYLKKCGFIYLFFPTFFHLGDLFRGKLRFLRGRVYGHSPGCRLLRAGLESSGIWR